MKIFKIAQAKTFQLIQPNPTAPASANLGIQVQNLQFAQQALNSLSEVVTAVNELKAQAAAVEDLLGVATGLNAAIDQSIKNAMTQNSAMNLLIQMNLIPSVEKLFDAGFMSLLQTNIAKNITSATAQQASMTQMQGAAQ
jgi:hypothetical protein